MTQHADFAPSAEHIHRCEGAYNATCDCVKQVAGPEAAVGAAQHNAFDAAHLLGSDDPVEFLPACLQADDYVVDATRRGWEARKTVIDGLQDIRTERRLEIGAVLGDRYRSLIYGTPDLTGMTKDGEEVVNVDYKFGRNPVSPAHIQSQLYGIALMAESPRAMRLRVVIIGSNFPDADGNCVFTHVWTRGHIEERARATAAHILAALEPDAKRRSGTWCRYCPASGSCRENHDRIMGVIGTHPADPALGGMTNAQVAWIVEHSGQIEDFTKAVRRYATERLIAGDAIPNLKLVAGPGSRPWNADEATVIQHLVDAGFALDSVAPRRLASVPQAEKLGKDALPIVTKFSRKTIGVPTAVPLKDRRKPINAAAKSSGLAGGSTPAFDLD